MTLPAGVAEAAYRITGEALHNVARHSRASRCEVALTRTDGTLGVRITDNGVGLRGPTTTGGVGLDSMRRRAGAAGGSFKVESWPTYSGTLLQVCLPLVDRT